MLVDDPLGGTLGYLSNQKILLNARPNQSEVKLFDYI